MILNTLLAYAKKKISPKDAEIIFCEVLHLDFVSLITKSHIDLTDTQVKEILKKIEERISGKSIAEIFKKKFFFGEKFFVTNDVLTPRPETEFLVEKVLTEIKNNPQKISGVIDIGTGSSCIISSIAKNIEKNFNGNFIASDISQKALDIAKINATQIVPHRKIDFRKSNLFEQFSSSEIFQKIIVTNLPYIPEKDKEWMDREVLVGDPHIALFSGENGVDLYKKFFLSLKHIQHFYAILFEYNPPQTRFFNNFLKETFPQKNLEFFSDLSGKMRFGMLK